MNAITSHRRAMCRMSAPTASTLVRMSDRVAKMETTLSGIRIGSATIQRQRIEATPDADKLQAALLTKADVADRYVGWTLAGSGLAVAVMAVMGWLPGAGA